MLANQRQGVPAEELAANTRLSFKINQSINYTASFVLLLEGAHKQLTQLDAFNHDEELSDSQRDALGEWRLDPMSAPVTLCVSDIQQAVDALQKAHQRIAGLLRGEQKDRFEEALLRTLHGVEARHAQFEELAREYELPKQPFAIRKNSLSVLARQCLEMAQVAKGNYEASPKGSADFLVEFNTLQQQMFELKRTFDRLRDNPTQKMSEPLTECLQEMRDIHRALNELERRVIARSTRPY